MALSKIEIVFWLCLFVVFYAYIGYGFVLFVLIKIKRVFSKQKRDFYSVAELPEATLIVACYNEEDILKEKIRNTLDLKYPKGQLNLFFVTDGSTDKSSEIIDSVGKIQHFHSPERRGKVAAVNRVMPFVTTPIVIYTDANTFLNDDAIINIVRHYKDPKVGAVAGEKRIKNLSEDHAAGSGEGAYWKYESALKRWDSELHSVVGAAGELFSIRTELFKTVPENILIEDCFVTLNIAKDNYVVRYEPEAYAEESSSADIKEEYKRKIRISAGGVQVVHLFPGLWNIFKYGWLSFQYVSHRALRWSLAPLCLFFVLALNFILVADSVLYEILFYCQLLFYTAGAIGWILQNRNLKIKAFFIPFYFLFMNYSVFIGFFRYLKGKQTVVWDKAKRAAA